MNNFPPNRPVTITLPSGRTVTIEATPVELLQRQQSGEKPKRRPMRRQACEHVGKALDVPSGCQSTQRNGIWECSLYGQCAPMAFHQIDAPGVVTCRYCDDWQAAEEPGWGRLGLNLLTAMGKWVAAGKPVRSQERVNELFSICASCPFLGRGKNGTYCGACGCPVNRQLTNRNKLYLATEACPKDRFPADVTVS